jgi:UDP-N-acetylglucosamine:LPS N-acetylglucosamine transferase
MTGPARRPHVLLVASGGGHWVQLLRLRPAFEDCDTTYVCVRKEYAADVPGRPFLTVNDANRSGKLAAAVLGIRMLLVVARLRPDVVVSTGAAPGYFAVRFGKWFGARTLWLDSIANVERLSLSGQMVRRHADVWLTQWPHLATEAGPEFAGAVL